MPARRGNRGHGPPEGMHGERGDPFRAPDRGGQKRGKLVRNKMNRYVIGITGGIACGKTNLTDALTSLGAAVIDADEVSRALTAPGGEALAPIRAAFGDGVFREGKLDRRALGGIVFSDPDKKKKLEDILHPMIRDRISFLLDKSEGIVFLSAPLLFECGYEKKRRQWQQWQ